MPNGGAYNLDALDHYREDVQRLRAERDDADERARLAVVRADIVQQERDRLLALLRDIRPVLLSPSTLLSRLDAALEGRDGV